MARTSLAKIRQKYKETHPETPEWIEFSIDDSKDSPVFKIHHPLFQTNKEKQALVNAQSEGNDFLVAQALLGEQYDEYETAGGQVSDLMLLLINFTETMQDTDDEGKSTTR